MRTIRAKIAFIFTMFMVLLVLIGIGLNALFLEQYYIYKNRDVFISVSETINLEYMNNKKNIDNFIDLIDRVDGINSTIADKNLAAKYNSFPQKSDPNPARLPNEIEYLILQNKQKLDTSYIYTVVGKSKAQAPKLIFISRMDNGEILILKKPMKGIGESVSIANQFFLLSGLLVIGLGGIFIFVFSKKVTKPVVEMSKVAESIANLDFSKRVLDDSQDEIGDLGRSMNHISEKLSDSMDALRLDVERRKQLVRNISHELKTPIGVIKGYAEGLKYGLADDRQKIEKYCTVIAEESDRMDRMVRELLSASLLESGALALQTSTFSIGECIRQIAGRFENLLEERAITLGWNDQSNVQVTADYELIERAISNFIINAIHHADGRKQIQVTVSQQDQAVRVTVFNTGKAIPEEDLAHIWDVFYKVDKARSREDSGHGLGLSIVKLIAELHRGSAGVENVEGGVQFYLQIPSSSEKSV